MKELFASLIIAIPIWLIVIELRNMNKLKKTNKI